LADLLKFGEILMQASYMVSKNRRKSTVGDDELGPKDVVSDILTNDCPTSEISYIGHIVVELLDGAILGEFHADFDSVFLVDRVDDHASLTSRWDWDEEAAGQG
jgi:hypothetical protein